MPLVFKCPKCDNLIIIKFLKIGELTVCKKCKQEVLIPDLAREFSIEDIKSKHYLRYINAPITPKHDSEEIDPRLSYRCTFCGSEEFSVKEVQQSEYDSFLPHSYTYVICNLCQHAEVFRLSKNETIQKIKLPKIE
jgi:DNA-directed RNA polymerase subunit M/transcription elongation factor TFIIS